MHFQSFGILPSPSLLMRQGGPAADLAALDAFGFPSVIETALAAFSLAASLLRTCVRADPAADFAALLACRGAVTAGDYSRPVGPRATAANPLGAANQAA